MSIVPDDFVEIYERQAKLLGVAKLRALQILRLVRMRTLERANETDVLDAIHSEAQAILNDEPAEQ